MQNVVPKEGPRAPLFCSVATSLLLLASVAQPQTVDMALLEECASLGTSELKLACFEALIVANSPSDAEIPDAGSAIIAETVPTADSEVSRPAVLEPTGVPDAPAPDPAPGARSMAAAEAVPIVIPANTSPGVELAPEGTERQDSVAENSSDPVVSEPPAAEFGAEQLPDRDRDTDQTITATVVEVRQGYNRTLSFHMADGQVWRQTEPRRLQYPKNEEFEVIISQGILGEYRLRIGENGRLVKIRRIQ
ncbi:MAG: hypothetical protein ACR2Q3_06090 [Woeseiaceae bacterium]